MSQCVPSWDLVDQSVFHERPSLRSNSNSTAPNVPLLDYEVAELTWENGQVAMHGFGVPRLSMKPASSNVAAKYTWEKPRGGTLESIVNQATHAPPRFKTSFHGGAKNEDLVPWFDHRRSGSASATIAMDALVPCSNRAEGPVAHVTDTSLADCSIDRVGSCSVAGDKDDALFVPVKRAKLARVPSPQDWSSRDQSVTGSETIEKDSQRLSLDTYDDDLGAGFTSTSPENTISGRRCSKSTTVDDHNSICHSRPQRIAGEDDDKKKRNGKKSSVSIKRSRAAAVHNQSERKRRDKINQRMKTLQKLVPNSSKTDKASMLDEVIEYLKQLQAQVQMMRMHTPAMMLPLPAMNAMQQQLQMSMLQASMGLGPMMGAMGMGVDMNSIGRANIAGIPPVLHPAAPFMFVNPWDSSGDRLQAASSGLMPDPMCFLPCQSPPLTMEAYCRLAAMYQQFQQAPISSSKN